MDGEDFTDTDERGGIRRIEQSSPGGLLDLLSVSAIVLDSRGRIVFWSRQADQVFGYAADEALGEYAGRLLVHEQHRDLVLRLFAEVMETGAEWAGAFPVRHKDGSTRWVEFRNMRLQDDLGDLYALGIAADQALVRGIETKLALSDRLVHQSPIGVALLDADLRYLMVNPALERINGVPASGHLGRRPRDMYPQLDVDAIESALRQVLASGTPVTTIGHGPRVRVPGRRGQAPETACARRRGARGGGGVPGRLLPLPPAHRGRGRTGLRRAEGRRGTSAPSAPPGACRTGRGETRPEGGRAPARAERRATPAPPHGGGRHSMSGSRDPPAGRLPLVRRTELPPTCRKNSKRRIRWRRDSDVIGGSYPVSGAKSGLCRRLPLPLLRCSSKSLR